MYRETWTGCLPFAPFRRRLLGCFLILGLSSFFLGSNPVCSLAASPNIVFILADDLGWADVAFHGGNAPTPNLDRLAASGLELTQHYVAPVCSPTRAGFLTGRCWSRFDVTTPTNSLGLPWATRTLPRALKEAGYDTCLIGKWHLGSLPQQGPNHFGFDHSYGSLAGGVSPWNHRYKQGPFSETWHRNEGLLEETGHVTDLLTAEAVRWIETRGEAPFFLYVPFTAVHLPLKEPDQWLSQVPQGITGDVPRHYAASVMHLDHSVQQIQQALQAVGKLENTLFVFTSDNGGSTVENNDLKYPDDHCPNGKLPGNNQPFRGEKGTLYEGGIRVPALVSWPARIRPSKIATPVQIIDWMPTFCALAGVAGDSKWDGIDLSPMLLDQAELPVRSLYTVAPSWRGRALRRGDWKLVEMGTGENRRFELFNLASDPSEELNLVDDPAQARELMRLKNELNRLSKSDKDAVAPSE